MLLAPFLKRWNFVRMPEQISGGHKYLPPRQDANAPGGQGHVVIKVQFAASMASAADAAQNDAAAMALSGLTWMTLCSNPLPRFVHPCHGCLDVLCAYWHRRAGTLWPKRRLQA